MEAQDFYKTLIPVHPSAILLVTDSIAKYNTHFVPQSAALNNEETYTGMELQMTVRLLYPDGFLVVLTL
jgi:hypothetical protein